MPAERYELSAPREVEDKDGGEAKSYWTNNIGVMFPLRSGDGYVIKLAAVPVQDKDGQITIIAKPPREKDQGSGGGSGGGGYGGY